ncbi:hypothetical protein CKJ76_20400 [Mycobacterium avium]|uniref:DUF5642 domain-containing protein n=7 Tax=Mycobacterium avium complex (MAC) TaxID=120793 RepID=A0ABX3SKW5_MYCBC|nr:hypothetical protein L838_1900 [Mycobacterium avium MAV_120709_2344]ORA57825.1 hypothetical protein BST19_00480 [Mycobacterium bouchedurhonense]PBA69863.1 hypothetical protein CKJ76_20400 [Mycobacterium avium]
MLADDEDIEDVTLLAEHQVPGWLQRLDVPPHWQLIDFPDSAEPSLTRMAVRGPLGNGEWQAADTISVFAYTGWPAFYDVFQSADRTLRGLNAAGIAVRVLPVPPVQRTAAIRSIGSAAIGERNVWVEQTHYVAGSEQPQASRLIVHTILVEATSRPRFAEDVNRLSNAVYQGFVGTLANECSNG